jgi:hypothetical protein
MTDVKDILGETLVSEGMDADGAGNLLEMVENYCNTNLDNLVGCTAAYNKDTWYMDIYKDGVQVNCVSEWAGELNHYKPGLLPLISLIYDSGYSLKDLGLGEE